MIYLLLFILIILFCISYFFTGKDFFAPSTVQILTFAGTVFMCIYFMWSIEAPHEFHWITIGVIVSAMAWTTVWGIVIHTLFRKVEIQPHTPETILVSPITETVSFLVIGFLLFTIAWLLSEIWRIGGLSGSFNEIMNRFHSLHSYSTDEMGDFPWILNQFVDLTKIIFFLFGFNLIRFFSQFSLRQKMINFLVLGLCAIEMLLNGGRTSLVNYSINCFMLFHLLRIQKEGKYKQYHFKSLLRIAFLVVIVFGVFFLTKSFVGRSSQNETLDIVDYIAYYTGTQYICLDKYFQNPPVASDVWGKETFYSLISFMIRYKLVNIQPYIQHLEFRSVGGGFSNNVYTSLRLYHYDFGWTGMLFLHSLSIIILSVYYEYTKKKRSNLSILIFGLIYYTIVMSFFFERFFTNIFSPNFIKVLVETLILYELFIRKRIKLVFRSPIKIRGLQTFKGLKANAVGSK